MMYKIQAVSMDVNVNIKATQDVINTGNIHGDKQVNINAGRDINVGAHVDRLEHHDIVSRQGTIGVAKDGDLVLSAKRDVNLKRCYCSY